jgi:hypothetical protein
MFLNKFASASLLLAALFLTACDSKNISNSTKSSPANIASSVSASPIDKVQSGMVAEIDGVHLELKPEKEANATHLDLFVQQSDSHSPIADAKVVALVQSPDGKEQSFPMKYDAQDKHYTAILPGKAVGQYQVKIAAEIKGKTISGRFLYSR